MSERHRLLSISTFSMVTRLTPRALRLYDEKGLLKPHKREITGFRYYHYDQIGEGIQLQQLASLGFGIHEMKLILEARQDPAGKVVLDDLFEQRLAEVDQEMVRLEEIRGSLRHNTPTEVMQMEPSEMIEKELPAHGALLRQ